MHFGRYKRQNTIFLGFRLQFEFFIAASPAAYQMHYASFPDLHDAICHMLELSNGEFPPLLRFQENSPNGYGFAVRKGLELMNGDAVAVFMADDARLIRFENKKTTDFSNFTKMISVKFVKSVVTRR